MFIVDVGNDHVGGLALEGGLEGRAAGVADLATFMLHLAAFGASAAAYFHYKGVSNSCWVFRLFFRF